MHIAQKKNVVCFIEKVNMFVGQKKKKLKERWVEFKKKWGKNWEGAGDQGGLKNLKKFKTGPCRFPRKRVYSFGYIAYFRYCNTLNINHVYSLITHKVALNE